jgi:hypothetical protein
MRACEAEAGCWGLATIVDAVVAADSKIDAEIGGNEVGNDGSKRHRWQRRTACIVWECCSD